MILYIINTELDTDPIKCFQDKGRLDFSKTQKLILNIKLIKSDKNRKCIAAHYSYRILHQT